MLRPTEQTTSTLQLVATDMSDIMENLDTRELHLDDGQYDTPDTNHTGRRVCVCVCVCVCVKCAMCVCVCCWCTNKRLY